MCHGRRLSSRARRVCPGTNHRKGTAGLLPTHLPRRTSRSTSSWQRRVSTMRSATIGRRMITSPAHLSLTVTPTPRPTGPSSASRGRHAHPVDDGRCWPACGLVLEGRYPLPQQTLHASVTRLGCSVGDAAIRSYYEARPVHRATRRLATPRYLERPGVEQLQCRDRRLDGGYPDGRRYASGHHESAAQREAGTVESLADERSA